MIIKSMRKDQDLGVFAILNRVTRISLTEKIIQERNPGLTWHIQGGQSGVSE